MFAADEDSSFRDRASRSAVVAETSRASSPKTEFQTLNRFRADVEDPSGDPSIRHENTSTRKRVENYRSRVSRLASRRPRPAPFARTRARR
jgi:hypothetical protein